MVMWHLKMRQSTSMSAGAKRRMKTPLGDLAHSAHHQPDQRFTDVRQEELVLGTVNDLTLEEDEAWGDAVAEVTASITPAAIPGDTIGQHVHVVNERVLRKLVRGKTIEAISIASGSSALTVRQYEEQRDSLNSLTTKLEEPSFPTYKTLLYNSLHILKSSVFVRHCTVEALVDTSRAGVQQGLVLQQQSGVDPMVNFTVVFPSAWAEKDVLLYGQNISTMQPGTTYPRIAYIESSIMVQPLFARNISHCMFEVCSESPGHSTGVFVTEGSEIQLTITGHRATTIFRSEQDVQIIEAGRRSKTTVRLILVATLFMCEDNPSDDSYKCDASTVLLNRNGRTWNDAVLIHRFAPPAGSRSSFLRITGPDGSRESLRLTSLLRHNADNEGSATVMMKAFGVLEDGSNYAIMRCLLYTDDFKPHGFRQASCGGCYILPLGVPPWERRGVNSIRILGVTPTGVSSNHIVRAVSSDIANCSSVGIPVEFPDKTKLTLFLDIVGYLGDYPAMVHMLDVTGVHGVAPCNFCTFRRASTINTDVSSWNGCETSSYGYSSSIHSANLSFRRSKDRMRVCRSARSGDELKEVGLRDLTEEQVKQLPLHYLSDCLEAVRHGVPKDINGNPVVPCNFDPYLSCVVAPDHLLAGLGQDILQAVLSLLRPEQRIRVSLLSTHTLAAAGYNAESALLAAGSHKVHQMSFSSLANYFIVVPWAVRVTTKLEALRAKDGNFEHITQSVRTLSIFGLFLFQRLRHMTYYIPRRPVDGDTEVQFKERKCGKEYVGELQRLCVQYVSFINRLCGLSERVRGQVDKPNLHRSLELYFHSIPRIGHASLFRELILESGHQPLKKGFKSSNNHDAHIFAMTRSAR